MPTTLEERVTALEGKMQSMEINPQPGQNQVFSTNFVEIRGDLAEIRTVQAKHGQTLDIHTGQLAQITSDLRSLKLDMQVLESHLNDFRNETSGKLTRLDSEVTQLKTDVSGLKTDVSGLRSELAEFKTEVRGTFAEILDRLPPKAA